MLSIALFYVLLLINDIYITDIIAGYDKKQDKRNYNSQSVYQDVSLRLLRSLY